MKQQRSSYFTVNIAQYMPPKSWPLIFLLQGEEQIS